MSGGEALAAFSAVDSLTFRPRPRRGRLLWARVKGAADFVSHNFPASERLFVALNPYPRPFRLVRVPMSDGAGLAAWLGPGRAGAPGLVLTPGTFHTKDDTARKAKAIRIWRSWGWHVLAMDLRGFGGSTEALGTGGLLESRDVLDAARWLRAETSCASVAVVGESLGGAAVLNAVADRDAEGLVCAATAWSPFADCAEAIRNVSGTGPARGELAAVRRAYRAMVWARSRGRYRGFEDYLAERAAALGLGLEELYARASPLARVGDVRVPTLVVHAEDDPIVPVRHARLLAEAARGNPRVAVRVLPAGGHLMFDAVDEAWYWGAMEAFLRPAAEAAARTA